MADIIYTYKDSVYANITNKCNCRCTFCIRFVKDGVGDADTLWHQVNTSKKEVIDAIKNFDFTGYKELVFCGYGEPTCQLDILLDAANYARKEKGLKIRLTYFSTRSNSSLYLSYTNVYSCVHIRRYKP